MKRRLFALLGSIVVTGGGLSIATVAPAQAHRYLSAGKSAAKPAEQEVSKDRFNSSQEKQEDLQALPYVLNAVVKDASERTGKPTSEFNIVQAKQHTWFDNCLGLSGSGVSCTEGKIPGWEIILGSGESRLVYHTNLSGTLVKWDSAASRGVLAQTRKPNSTQQAHPIRPSSESKPIVMTSTPPSPVSRPNTTKKPLPLRPIVLPEQVGLPMNSPPKVPESTPPQQISVRPISPNSSDTRPTEVAIPVSFEDIPADYWAKDFIAELAQKGIVKGSNGRTFRPDVLVTRGELAAMLSLAFKKPNIREAVEFKDVSPNDWVYSYLQDVYQRGFFDLEPDNVVNPTKNVTRLDVIVALAKGLNYSSRSLADKVLQVYSDRSAIPSELRNLVAAATERGMVVNYPDVKLLNPDKPATRAEVAALIYQGMVSTGDAVGITSPYVVGEQKNTGSVRNVREVDRRPRDSSN